MADGYYLQLIHWVEVSRFSWGFHYNRALPELSRTSSCVCPGTVQYFNERSYRCRRLSQRANVDWHLFLLLQNHTSPTVPLPLCPPQPQTNPVFGERRLQQQHTHQGPSWNGRKTHFRNQTSKHNQQPAADEPTAFRTQALVWGNHDDDRPFCLTHCYGFWVQKVGISPKMGSVKSLTDLSTSVPTMSGWIHFHLSLSSKQLTWTSSQGVV